MQTHTLVVEPVFAPGLQTAVRLLANIAWSYEPALMALCEQLDRLAPRAPGAAATPPLARLRALSLAEQERLLADKEFKAALVTAEAALAGRGRDVWGKLEAAEALAPNALIAYFSAEFGLHESLPIYAGGLGILAGDHLKSASDLGLPLVGVGLFYGHGYHEQTLGADHAPRERYVHTDLEALGASLCTLPNGERLTVHVRMGARTVHLQVWELFVGRTRLLLLDADVPENAPHDRGITRTLYGGDHHTRIEQELALGIGGTFALEALGLKPTVYHLNEGHAAFLTLARLHIAMRDLQLPLEAAMELVAASNVFTTHTPIAAGNDVFVHGVLRPYLAATCDALGLPLDWVLDLGHETAQVVPSAHETRFSMTAFALRSSRGRNGVSVEHGDVSRHLWHALWPGLTAQEVPITSVTNGVHMRTWAHPKLRRHYEAPRLDAAAFWADKRERRQVLIDHVNQRRAPSEHLSADVCTIGFARRFAEYKRALLLFSDPARLKRLLGDAKRPLQLLFAGKAHPNAAKEKANIKALHDIIEAHGLRAHIAFVENYDISVARLLVQGVDVWLNTPRPPLEASGTSGMKVVLNGGMNVSVRDGWWKEAYAPGLGWAVGDVYDPTSPLDDTARDNHDAHSLYAILEREVAPSFYAAALPEEWIARCIASGKALHQQFCATRMVEDYARTLYAPAHRGHGQRFADRGSVARQAAAERAERVAAFSGVGVSLATVQASPASDSAPLLHRAKLAQQVVVRAHVSAERMTPAELRVDVVVGVAQGSQNVFAWQHARVFPMQLSKGAHGWVAEATLPLERIGSTQLAIRVMPALASVCVVPAVRFA